MRRIDHWLYLAAFLKEKKLEKDLMRPIYDHYRKVKRILGKNSVVFQRPVVSVRQKYSSLTFYHRMSPHKARQFSTKNFFPTTINTYHPIRAIRESNRAWIPTTCKYPIWTYLLRIKHFTFRYGLTDRNCYAKKTLCCSKNRNWKK